MSKDDFINQWADNAYKNRNLENKIIDQIIDNLDENQLDEDNLFDSLTRVAFEEDNDES